MDPLSAHTSPAQTAEERLRVLSNIARDVELSPGLSIDQYLRAMLSMLRMIDMHIVENRQESAFVLASKFLTLFLEVLPKHKEFGKINSSDMTWWKQRCKATFRNAENLKESLLERYMAEHEDFLRKQDENEEREEDENGRLSGAEVDQDVRQLLPEPPPSPPPISTQPIGPVHVYTPPPHPRPVSYPSLPRVPELNTANTAVPKEHRCTQPPPIDRSLKPQTKSIPHGWLPVRMSFRLADRFLQLAEPNTTANRETCASLCGKLVGNEYRITDVVITKQSGTPDSCTTHNEEELFEYMEKRNLILLGWIHTHPSQTAFLSSVDQHTQLSYQIMLPEAISIVCSPKFNEVAAFSLNPGIGIPFVRQCKESGFHPHPKAVPIYEPCPHLIDDPNAPFTVVDLR
ncbi:unnamed protein product [Echinostoma caproni]|uniref:MPN domain-containing protein n=1 Tax=Echinostoma caproni TaxID=27848 RepID=A0A183AVC6_9TREM|nr:unnamed protein product [Echinostoma caproni]